jgi:S1-C subfamily serine protease
MTRGEFLTLMAAAAAVSSVPGFAMADAAPDNIEDSIGMVVHMTDQGAVVDRVFELSAAAVAGVRVGDVLLTIGDEDVRNFNPRQIRRLSTGFARDTTLRLRRGRRIVTVRLVRPPYAPPRPISPSR